MKSEKISELTTNRLSIYLRCLNELAAEGSKTVSSDNLAKRFHLNSAQIRKDLACFGEFGVRGVGYYVEDLRQQLTKILGLDHHHRVGIIGAGRLGTALTDYYGFRQTNFEVAALFDADREKIGTVVSDVKIYDVRDFAKIADRQGIDVAVIAVPAEYAQRVLEMIVASGIKAVMNFAPTPLLADEEIKLKTIDLTISLESLSYFLAGSGKNGKE
ncbi:MAG: redox-sensing transcriptional repressor Rex [Acidobacteria bacterium]|nr:MAG: redox-sensing transcriptional repressor Rex [Acidobacteriota bacterium]REK02321.1 MAG: redox-sensing transcriptional repressor Rex [Acidobacteriota bacterium]REK13876.1 MAG: redox-sensing transcriptional repressor Rex [Acidobacteriota bacterium]REK41870.1 MAG: redox-sensing transcriptional repressor Rex [Acidobacteriota bacterium]